MTKPVEMIDFDGGQSVNFILCTSSHWVGKDWHHRESTEKHIISIPKAKFDKDIVVGDSIYLVGRLLVVKRIQEKTGLINKLTEISTDFYDIIDDDLSN